MITFMNLKLACYTNFILSINCPVVPYLFTHGLCGVCCCLQACPKLIERFKEREENVKVLIDLSEY